jgi:hypothetical protein
MARVNPQTSLEQSQKYGRICFSCGYVTKIWSMIRQKKCDICLAKKNHIEPGRSRERWLNGN